MMQDQEKIGEIAEAFGVALERERMALRMGVHDVARRACVNEAKVRAWIAGEAIPSGTEFARLVGSMRGLERYRQELLRARAIAPEPSTRAPLTQRPLAILAALPAAPPAAIVAAPSRAPSTQAASPTLEVVPARSFGDSLYQARTRARLTAQELGDLCDVNVSTVYAWERNDNEPEVDSLRKLYDLLGQHGLDFKIKGAAARKSTAKARATGATRGLEALSTEELKAALSEATARLAEIKAEIADRRERLLAQARALED